MSQSDNNKHKDPEFVRKKNGYRQQVRREFLDEFFSKKRAEFFGWFAQENQNQHNQQQSPNQDVEIDKHLPLLLEQSVDQNLQPHYNENYFYSTNLLQKLIQNKAQDPNQLQSHQFKYQSFYEFLIGVIKQSLDQRYFEKFENNKLFEKHFNALKDKIYQKLGEQFVNFLTEFSLVNQNILQEQTEPLHEQSLYETCSALVIQIMNFFQSSNLQVEQANEWPLISIEQQLVFLLKILIEITYYDQKTNTEDILDQIDKTKCRQHQIIGKYLQKFENTSQDQESVQSSNQNSVTRYLVKETDLLQRLKFLIVFGHPQHRLLPQKQSISAEKRTKYRQINLIIRLLTNIISNIGSDDLLKSGIIGELKCLLNEPFESSQFTVKISSKRRGHAISQIHQHIICFILHAYEMIQHQSSLDYLSENNSLGFVFQSLINVTAAKRQLQNTIQYSETNTFVGDQFLLVDCKDQDHDIDGYEEQDCDQIIQQKSSPLKSELNRLTRLGQQCIASIEFHLSLGQKMIDTQYWVQNGKQKEENRKLMKLRYLMDTSKEDSIFVFYESGEQLMKRWKLFQK